MARYYPDLYAMLEGGMSQLITVVIEPKELIWAPDRGTRPPSASTYGGDGTWNANATNDDWYDPSTGTNVPWDNSGNAVAMFEGTPGNVAVEGQINVAAMEVDPVPGFSNSYAIVPDSAEPADSCLAFPRRAAGS